MRSRSNHWHAEYVLLEHYLVLEKSARGANQGFQIFFEVRGEGGGLSQQDSNSAAIELISGGGTLITGAPPCLLPKKPYSCVVCRTHEVKSRGRGISQ